MKSASVVFCCLLGLLAIGQVLGQTDPATSRKLMMCVRDGYTGGACSDELGTIRCLENVVVGANDAFGKMYKKSLLESSYANRDVCPAAYQAGSCLEKQIADCKDEDEFQGLYYPLKNCSSKVKIALCLGAVEMSCNTSTATAKIVNEQGFMACDGCQTYDMYNCLTPVLPNSNDWSNVTCTAEAINQVTQCLDAKDSACTYLIDTGAQFVRYILNKYCPSSAV